MSTQSQPARVSLILERISTAHNRQIVSVDFRTKRKSNSDTIARHKHTHTVPDSGEHMLTIEFNEMIINIVTFRKGWKTSVKL